MATPEELRISTRLMETYRTERDTARAALRDALEALREFETEICYIAKRDGHPIHMKSLGQARAVLDKHRAKEAGDA